MRIAALLIVALGLFSAAAGLYITFLGFAPIPFADSFEFLFGFFTAGGWDGYGFQELYARHNEHRLVVPRLWFLADLALFDGTQAFLIVTTILSAALHAGVLTALFRQLEHRGPLLWLFAAAALGAVLSPAQWENFVWGFQVQFIQVWLFATLSFLATALANGRRAWCWIAAAVVAGLASTYSMANGLLVWPLLVVLALWCRIDGGRLWLLIAAAATVLTVELAGFHAHPGHGDPVETISRPLTVLRYAFRYLANAVGAIGPPGQEIVGATLLLMVTAMAIDALLRPQHYRPAHAVLLAVAGFVIGAALVTALGRVSFGLEQASATRYATPSFIFLVVCLGLLLDRLARIDRAWMRAGGATAAGVLLLAPGLVAGLRHIPTVTGERDARINAVVTYLAGGYRPEALKPLFPFLPEVPYRLLIRLEKAGWGPFADPGPYKLPRSLTEVPPKPSQPCRGHVDRASNDPDGGVTVIGWATAPGTPEHPRWVIVTDATGAVVAWGASRVRRDDVGNAVGTWWRGRGFHATGPRRAAPPMSVVGVFRDGRSCLLAGDVTPQ